MNNDATSDDALRSRQLDQLVGELVGGHVIGGVDVSEIADMTDLIVGGTMVELRNKLAPIK